MTIVVRVLDDPYSARELHMIVDPRDSIVQISRTIRSVLEEMGLPRSFEVRWCDLALENPERVIG